MFLGEYEHNIDVKGRLAVPAKFRPHVGDGLVVTRGFERCLQVYPRERWDKLSALISDLPLGNAASRQVRRLLFGSAFDTELDRQGRILIPANLREYAGIREQAVVAGMNTYFEIWAKTSWDATLEDIDASGITIAEQLAEIGI